MPGSTAPVWDHFDFKDAVGFQSSSILHLFCVGHSLFQETHNDLFSNTPPRLKDIHSVVALRAELLVICMDDKLTVICCTTSLNEETNTKKYRNLLLLLLNLY